MRNKIRLASSRAACLVALIASLLAAAPALAATITVNSLADDQFPDGAGVVTNAGNVPPPYCTLRMALAAVNLQQAIGGANGCPAGTGSDQIGFNVPLPGTLLLANQSMAPNPTVFGGGFVVPPLFAARTVTINGPGSSQLTIDGSLAAVDGRRIIAASDANGLVAFTFTVSGVRFTRGTAPAGGPGGCMATTENLVLNDVVFDGCESRSSANDGGYAGALYVGVDDKTQNNVAPNVTIDNSRFAGNRAVHGASPLRSEGGAIALGGTQVNIDSMNGTSSKVGTVTINNTIVTGNIADTRAGMIIGGVDSVTIDGSQFVGNQSTGNEAASTSGRHAGFLLAGINGTAVIKNSRIVANTANETRAGFGIQGVSNGGSVTIDNVVVSGNIASRQGIAGMEITPDSFCTGGSTVAVTITNVKVTGNSAATQAGGGRVACAGTISISDSEFSGNEVRGYRFTPGDIVPAVSYHDTALQVFTAPSATFTRLLFTRNNSTGYAAVLVADVGSFTADSVRLVDHNLGGGPALLLQGNGPAQTYVVRNSEISGNSSGNVPAIFMEGDGQYTLRNTTVSGNVSRNQPGVVEAFALPGQAIAVNIEHSTIARNTAPGREAFSVVAAGGASAGNGTAVTLRNSIFGGRAPGYTANSAVFFDAANGVTNVTGNNSLIENSTGAPPALCAATGMKCDVGAVVNAIADNGGATGVRTMALLAGSPAINGGGAVLGGLTTDARGAGFPRVIGAAVDMGALESDPATTTGCTLDADGNATTDALTDGLMLMRAMLGFGQSVTGVIGANATRATWAAVGGYLNANCGTRFAP